MTMRTRRKILYYIVLGNTVVVVLVYFLWNSLDFPKQRDESHRIRLHEMNFVQSSKAETAPPNKGNMDFKQTEQTMSMKLDKIREQCQNLSDESYWKRVIPHGVVWKYRELNYCIVPKVGCTYWKQILRFISHDYPHNSDIVRPSDIDRYFVHFGPLKKIERFRMQNTTLRMNMNNKAFMFTRDPYSRLWSGYIDKFWLPDFWRGGRAFGMMINPNSTEKELTCVKGLSFQDFLTTITMRWPNRLNDHWEPIHLMCSPCHVQYTAIGKLETFADDNNYISAKFDIHLSQIVSKRNKVFQEINTLATYNFNLEEALPPDCFYKIDVAQRLWKAFQYNGYIDRLIPFPTKEFETADFELHPTQTFVEIATKTIDNQTADIKSQRRSMMLEAYKEIPRELLDKIKAIYKYDFELFDYEKDVF